MRGGEDELVFNRFSGYNHHLVYRGDHLVESTVKKSRVMGDNRFSGYNRRLVSQDDHLESKVEKSRAMGDNLVDIANLSRYSRQKLYLKILESLQSGETLSPAQVKKILEQKYFMTFKYVGQDMINMRDWERVMYFARGRYASKNDTV
jgi:hypothetical protein